LDAYDRSVVGWQFAAHMRTDLVLDALRMALALGERVDEVQLVHHSDAGSQYTSFGYGQTLDDHRVLASIGRASVTPTTTRSPKASSTASRPS
jgi:putative transposase